MIDLRDGTPRAPVHDQFPVMSRALQLDAVSVHRRLFTSGTPKGEQRRLASRLARIAAAQRRLSDCTYGSCSACGNEVGAARLTAEPSAGLCSGCALVAPPDA